MKKIKKIIDKYNPKSIFLYGSRARGDYLPESDKEIGVLTDKEHNSFNGVFFFSYKDFEKGKIDTPFPVDIYLNELSKSGKTLYGKKVVENFTPPPVKTISLLERINFDCAIALAAFKNNSPDYFTKSALFGVRNLIILEKKTFPLKYEEIEKFAKKINLEKFSNLPEKAYKTRIGEYDLKKEDYKKNIAFTNKLIRNKIKKYYSKERNETLIK